VGEVDCVIRRAVPADAESLAELAARTFRDTFEADNSPEDMAAHLARSYSPALQLAEIGSPDIITLLAVCGSPVGFAQLRRGPVPACVTVPRPVELWRLYVDRAWHGRGVAGRLMAAAVGEAAAAGASAVWLGVWERNPRAIAFYRKSGFVEVGAHEFRLGADVQTDRVMVLALAGSQDAEPGAAVDRGRKAGPGH
jgi:ribosomal protein S18 acetylase RimI-like enzyme